MQAKKRIRLKVGDQVRVIAGKDKGKEGKIRKIFYPKDRLVVENVQMVKRHRRPTQADPKGGVMAKESPIHISNVMLVDPSLHCPTRVGRRWEKGKDEKQGHYVRYAKRSGQVLSS